MNAPYDKDQWEQVTTLGRRLYIHNFGMRGDEFAGWRLVKTVVSPVETDVSEKLYLWQPKKDAPETLVQVAVIESHYWRHAQQQLLNQLDHCMRPDIPQGQGKLATVGDVQYAASAQGAKEIGAIFFTRGNLQIRVQSVGKETVDVANFARKVDALLTQAPTKTQESKGLVKALAPVKVKAKRAQLAPVIEKLSEAVPRSGWTRVMASDGELRRDGEMLFIEALHDGSKKVEILNFKLE